MELGRLSSRYKGPHPSSLLAVKSSKVRGRECLVSLSSFSDLLLTEAGLVWAQLGKVSIVCNCISCVVSRMTFYSSSLCLLGRAYFLPLLQHSLSLRGASLNILSAQGQQPSLTLCILGCQDPPRSLLFTVRSFSD